MALFQNSGALAGTWLRCGSALLPLDVLALAWLQCCFVSGRCRSDADGVSSNTNVWFMACTQLGAYCEAKSSLTIWTLGGVIL